MANSDDPFRPDPTMMRPRPGGGRRTYVGGPSQSPSPPPSGSPADGDPLPPAASGLLAHGLNPLVQAASPLLLLAAQVRDTTQGDVTGLRRHTLEDIRRFEESARSAGVSNEAILAARYALCAGIDEAVLSTPWGSQSEWAQHPLLVTLHREAWGGEKFFDMLERMSKDPAKYIDLLELQYLLLAFGFEGKYGRSHAQSRGQEHLRDVQTDLYRIIRQHRGGATERSLSLRWRGLEDRRNPLVRYVPWWVVGLAALPILVLTFAAYRTTLARRAAPIYEALSRVSIDQPVPVAAPVHGLTLKQLLASEEAQGRLVINERGAETKITLRGSDLFASGSATVNTNYVPLLHQVTAALNRVPGTVRVIGHTDDQPVRSLRFANNWELSSERARSVVAVLSEGIDNPGRLTFLGMGESDPLAAGSDSASRALNRRVEIRHVRSN